MSYDLEKYCIRAAETADRRELIALMGALQAYECGFEPNRAQPSAMERIYFDEGWDWAHRSGGRVFTAESADGLIGCAICGIGAGGVDQLPDYQRVGRITDLIVLESERGGGVGEALIRACEAHFVAAGVNQVEIAALWGNEAARAAYAACGYRPYYVAHVRYLGGPLAKPNDA